MQREHMLAKFWLNPASLAKSRGFSAQELNKLSGIVEANLATFQKAWDDFFDA